MLGDAQFVPQAADFNDCKHQRKNCTGRTHPGPEDPSGFCVLLCMIRIEDCLLLIRQFRRYDGLLSILASDLSSLRRLLLCQEDPVDQDQDDHYGQSRNHRIEDVIPDDPGISTLQRLCHGENDLVQSQVSPLFRHPLSASACDQAECDHNVQNDPDDSPAGLLPHILLFFQFSSRFRHFFCCFFLLTHPIIPHCT